MLKVLQDSEGTQKSSPWNAAAAQRDTGRFKARGRVFLTLLVFLGACWGPQNRKQKPSESIELFLDVHLSAMNEPPLRDSAGEIYRFIYIPTFQASFAVRAYCERNECAVVGKLLDGKGGYDPGSLSQENFRLLPRRDWETLKDVVEETEFWAISGEEYRLGVGPLDSSLWILEGVRHGQRQVWIDWSRSQEQDPGPRELGLKLLELSEFEFELTDLD